MQIPAICLQGIYAGCVTKDTLEKADHVAKNRGVPGRKVGMHKEIFYYSPTMNPTTGREKTYERNLKNVEHFMKKTEPNQREARECFLHTLLINLLEDDAHG